MKSNDPDLNITMTECLIRLTAIEKLLIDKKIISQDDLIEETTKLSQSLIESIKASLSQN